MNEITLEVDQYVIISQFVEDQATANNPFWHPFRAGEEVQIYEVFESSVDIRRGMRLLRLSKETAIELRRDYLAKHKRPD